MNFVSWFIFLGMLKYALINHLSLTGLDSSDVEYKTSRIEPDSLRIKPLGFDSNDSIYWYFFGKT